MEVCVLGDMPGLGSMLQRYLMASYGYYVLHVSLMADAEYDAMARHLLTHWDKFEHQHKYLVTEGDLRAGTLYNLGEEDYPGMVKGGTGEWMKECGLKTTR